MGKGKPERSPMQAQDTRNIPEIVRITDIEGIRTAVVLSDLDRYKADHVHAILERAAAGQTEFILSLQCDYCDSYALAMIIAISRQIGEGCIIVANDRVRRILGVTGLDKIFRLAPSVADAVESLRSA
jgi:anti-anti-sigma factor